MEIILYIAATLALLAVTGLSVFLMLFVTSTKGLLGAVTTSLQALIAEISAIRVGLQGTINNMEGVVGKLHTTMDRVNGQLDEVEGIVGSVKNVTEDATEVVHGAKAVVVHALEFVDNVQVSVQRPITEVATIVSALGAWLEAFRVKLGMGAPTRRPALDGQASRERAIEQGADD